MEIKLQSLKLQNFKGIKSFLFEPRDKGAEIEGDNSTGKTTLYDAFIYLLFDKDSQGNSVKNFSIKTCDEDGQIKHNIDHVVEAELLVDGNPLKLKKNYREVWSKKRKVLKSHKTDYWVNDEPDILKKDYDKVITELVSPEMFKLLTSVTYFNEIKWEARRKILFQLCAGLTEDALEDAEKKKKILASKKKKINEQKDEIRPRIDELHRGIVLVADYDQAGIKARIAGLDKQIQTIKTDSSRFALLKEQGELEAKLSQLKADQAKKKQEVTSDICAEIEKIEDSCAKAHSTCRQTGRDITDQVKAINATETEINDLYSEQDKLVAEKPDILDLCPTCSKPFLPEEKEAVQAEFNLQQSKKNEDIVTAGKKARAKLTEAMEEKINLEVKLKAEQANLAKIDKALDKKKEELESILSPAERPKGDAEKVKIQERIAKIEGLLQQDDQEQNTVLLEVDLKAERAKLAEIDAAGKSKARIIELGEQEKTLSAEIERLEGELFHAEQSIQNQARLLEDEINNKFDLVKFQLFETQMNEGVRPTCITLIDGIPYGHGLNKGNEINAGLDIIKTLSQHYQIQCPVFIDNCESISYPIDPGCQCFKLIKVKDMEKLEIIYE